MVTNFALVAWNKCQLGKHSKVHKLIWLVLQRVEKRGAAK